MKTKFILLFLLLFSCKSINSISNSCDRCKCYYDEKLKTDVYITYDTSPKYREGEMRLYSLVAKNIFIPLNAYRPSTKVIVKIFINEEGIIVDLRIADKPEEKYNILEKEIIRVLFETKNNWISAQCEGKNVVSMLRLPFGFHFQEP